MPISTTYAFAFNQDTVSNTALTLLDIGFTQDEINKASRARITCAAQPIRYCYDGSVPTDTVGHYMAVNSETLIIGNANIEALQFIRATGTDGEVAITLEE